MIQNDDLHIQMLMNLGLTLLQAKVYLTLAELGKAEVKRISNASNVARPDVYRVISTLEQIGLAEKIITVPTMYKATPIKEGYYILLQNKTQEHTELQQKTMHLINSYKSNDMTTLQKEEQQFVLISSKTLLRRKWEIEDSTTQTCIDIIGGWEGSNVWFFKNRQNFERAIKRDVKIRIITEKHKGKKSLQKISPIFSNNPLFETRYISPPIPIMMQIYDRKKVSMYLEMPQNGVITPNLFSNNLQFAKIMVAYFEELWGKAQDSADVCHPET